MTANSNDFIIRYDNDYRHLYIDNFNQEYSEVDKDNYYGKTHRELGFPDDLCVLWEKAIDFVFENKCSHQIEFTLHNSIILQWIIIPEKDSIGKFETVLATARDVTNERNLEKQITNNQHRFKDAFQLARLSTWEVDIVNSRAILNPEFCSIIGIPYNSKSPYLESSVYYNEFVYDDDKERFTKKFLEANDSKDAHYQDILNYRVVRPDGEIIWIMATIRLRLDDKSNVIAAYGTFQDITSIKNTEEELAAHKLHLEELVQQRTNQLQQSESKLKDAVDLAKLSTWQFDIKTEKLTISGVLEKKLEKDRFEDKNTLKLEKFVETIHPDDFKGFYDAVQKAMTTPDPEYYDILSYRMYDAEKLLRYVNITVKVRFDIVNNMPEYLYGTIQDVTYLIESKIEKERLTSIIEATSDIVLIADVDHHVIYMNGAGKRFFNVDNSYVQDKLPVSNYFYNVREDIVNEVFMAIESDELWVGEGKIIRYDNDIVPVSIVIVAHKNHLNEIDCYSITLRDLSNQKKIENDLVYKNNELDTFVYRTSHDLRGPIASLLGLFNVVKHEVHDSKALEFFEMYNNQIIRLNETIVALIDLTRIKEQNTVKETIDIEAIIQDNINSFTHLPHYHKISFNTNIKTKQSIVTDKSLIKTITQNMIENAIKYARVDVASFIRIDVTTVNKQLVISVEDNGLGIDKEIHSKVFDMFFRGDTQAIGSGLGLYILKNAVEKLQGKIELTSDKGVGTTITVQIPINW